ncbi:MAG: pilus assembly protein [Anaerolineales bacterium]|nr:pilus assembly protein [Anaerolineales bacterium]
MLRKILNFLQTLRTPVNHRGIWRKTKAQSLVEFAITLPIVLLLLSGVVEFGFALNYYLSVLDASRQAARWGSNLDPFNTNGTDNYTFYSNVAAEARYNLDPRVVNPSYEGRRIVLDPAIDDVVVTVFSVNGTTVTRYPTAGSYRLYGNVTPIFNATTIANNLVTGAPNAGVLVVEVHHNYHQVLKLPWITPFVPDPMYLRAYSIMPLSAAEP